MDDDIAEDFEIDVLTTELLPDKSPDKQTFELVDAPGPRSPEPLPLRSFATYMPSPTKYVYVASVMAAMGGILFGYDIGIISGALLQLTAKFTLSCFQREVLVGAMLLGAVFGSIFGGFIIDNFGRRKAIIVNSAIFIIGAMVISLAPSYFVLVIGRLVLGFAVSLSATGECIYISELAPAHRRGSLVSLNELGITAGFLLAYLINFIFVNIYDGWRYMFGISIVPALIQGIGMCFLPPSPRFLVLKEKYKEAELVLEKIRGNEDVQNELNMIKTAIEQEKSQRFCDICSSFENMRGRMFIGAGLVFFQQLTGQPSVLAYAPTIFKSVDFYTNSAATFATVVLGTVKFVSTCIALLCVDRAGRRLFLLSGGTLMCVSLLILGIVTKSLNVSHIGDVCNVSEVECSQIISLNNNSQDLNFTAVPLSQMTNATHEIGNICANKSNNSVEITNPAAKWISFISLLVFVAAYSFSFGPVTWLMLTELYPASIRGRAISFVTILNWGTNLVVAFTFLSLIDKIGVSFTFIIYSGVCAISIFYIYGFVPETKNKTLEQISIDLNRGSTLHSFRQRLPRCLRWSLGSGVSEREVRYRRVDSDPSEFA